MSASREGCCFYDGCGSDSAPNCDTANDQLYKKEPPRCSCYLHSTLDTGRSKSQGNDILSKILKRNELSHGFPPCQVLNIQWIDQKGSHRLENQHMSSKNLICNPRVSPLAEGAVRGGS